MKMLRYENDSINGWFCDIVSQAFCDTAIAEFNLSAVNSLELKYTNTPYSEYTVLVVAEFWLGNEVIDYMRTKYGKIDCIINPFYTKIDLSTDIPVCLVDHFFRLFVVKASKFSTIDSDTVATVRPFNFMANRKRINRHLMIKLLEHFDLVNCAEYTWSGADSNYDLSRIIEELDSIAAPWASQIKSSMLMPVQTQPRWIHTDQDVYKSKLQYQTSNITSWEQGLNSIFNTTAVSLITESIDYQSGIGFTEKSMYPVLGLNLPIWVGGKYQASEFEKFGFDVFNDIIDHSYQYCDTLIERCYRAIADNRDILSNLDLATEVRSKVMPRLLKNRQLMLQVSADPSIALQRAVDSVNSWTHVPQLVKDAIYDNVIKRNLFKTSTLSEPT
jgi:hypothetical protein